MIFYDLPPSDPELYRKWIWVERNSRTNKKVWWEEVDSQVSLISV